MFLSGADVVFFGDAFWVVCDNAVFGPFFDYDTASDFAESPY